MNHTPRFACCLLFTRLVFGSVELEYVGMLMQCLETMVVVWMKMFPNQNGCTLAVSRREWRLNICTDSKVRMAAFAGRGGMEIQSSMWWRSPRHPKECAGVFYPSCVRVDCRNKLIKRYCRQDSRCLAETCNQTRLGRHGWEQKLVPLSQMQRQAVDATMNFCYKAAVPSSIPPLMADDVHVNVAPSLKARVGSLAKSIWERSFRSSFEKFSP